MQKSLSQTIKQKYQVSMAYHMTHVDNLPAILKQMELRSYNLMRGHSYRNLANKDVQAGRAAITIAVTEKPLHDYVPLYLGFKTPMVAINQEHNEDLLFLRFPLDILSIAGSVLSDGNARALNTKFHLFVGPDTFSYLDLTSVLTVKYAHDGEIKRKKQSEVLIPDRLSMTQMHDIVCYSETAKTRILSILATSGINKPVNVNKGWYFEPQTKQNKGAQ